MAQHSKAILDTPHPTASRRSPSLATSPSLESIGERYHSHRAALMKANQQGLTATYNRFHDADDRDPGIQTLRDLHVELDLAVLAAYGWDDLDLGHGFHETRQGRRFTVGEVARVELLDRLLELNHPALRRGGRRRPSPRRRGRADVSQGQGQAEERREARGARLDAACLDATSERRA
jgi:hypothetical protein